jgi:hypothetical protein
MSILWRRWKGITTSRGSAGEDKRLLNDQQEQQLLSHIRDLCDRCLPPTPAIVSEIASQIRGRAPGHNWCSRFVERHRDELGSHFLNSLGLERYQADSVTSFERYFSTIGDKIKGLHRTYSVRQKDAASQPHWRHLSWRFHGRIRAHAELRRRYEQLVHLLPPYHCIPQHLSNDADNLCFLSRSR